MQQPNGTANRYIYDPDGRLTGIDVGNTGNAPAIQYAYDPAGLRSSMVDPTGTTTYAYDAASRLTGVTAPTTGQVQYSYDPANQLATLTYPSGHQVAYGHTPGGQLASATDWQSHQTAYTYDDAGRLAQVADPNGVTSSLSYDVADRLTAVAHAKGGTTLEAIAYQLDPAGNRTQMTDSAGTTIWAYDALNRLTSASYPNGDQVSYALDPVGNRTGLTVNGATTTSAYDAADELTQAGATAYTWDANGNELTSTTNGVTTTYSYDPLNRLTGIAGPTTAAYSYNGDGLRVAKAVNGQTTTYTWDPIGLGRVLGDGSEYLWGQGLIGQVASTGSATYAHADGLGSVRLLTDAGGAVAGRVQYDAYGAPRQQSGAQLPFGYTGEQVDPESGLVYLRARYLDPTSGRFIARDTFAGSATRPQSLNRYTYAEGDPAGATDPTGHGACGIGPFVWQCPSIEPPAQTPTPAPAPTVPTPYANDDLGGPTPTPSPAAPTATPQRPIDPQPTPTPAPAELPCPYADPGAGGAYASAPGAQVPPPTPTPSPTPTNGRITSLYNPSGGDAPLVTPGAGTYDVDPGYTPRPEEIEVGKDLARQGYHVHLQDPEGKTAGPAGGTADMRVALAGGESRTYDVITPVTSNLLNTYTRTRDKSGQAQGAIINLKYPNEGRTPVLTTADILNDGDWKSSLQQEAPNFSDVLILDK